MSNDFYLRRSPIFIEEDDYLTQRAADRVLAHNELGVRL